MTAPVPGEVRPSRACGGRRPLAPRTRSRRHPAASESSVRLPRLLLLPLLLGLLFVVVPTAAGQTPPDSVPYVPTPVAVVSEMLRLGRVGPDDVLFDLGSGDGRIVITAAQRWGTRGVGFEIDPQLVRVSREQAAAAGVASRVQFLAQDLFTADLRAATVVTLYMSTEVNLRLRPKLLRELRPGARVVSHAFHMGEWEPDTTVTVGAGFAAATVHAWTVPADVDGFWSLAMQTPRGERGQVLELAQRFQRLSGAVLRDGLALPLTEGRVAGERISFTFRERAGRRTVTHHFQGRWTGTALEGSYRSSDRPGALGWRAERFTR